MDPGRLQNPITESLQTERLSPREVPEQVVVRQKFRIRNVLIINYRNYDLVITLRQQQIKLYTVHTRN